MDRLDCSKAGEVGRQAQGRAESPGHRLHWRGVRLLRWHHSSGARVGLQHGFGWLYRLAGEPRRLWKRTLISFPVFMWLVLSERLGTDTIVARIVEAT